MAKRLIGPAFVGCGCLALLAATVPEAAAQEAGSAQAPSAAAEPTWGFGISVFTVNPPDDNAYASTVLRADRGDLHLEGRWNYEDLHTGSLFVGKNFDWTLRDGEMDLQLVPMIGGVFGDTDGVAPAVEVDFTWKWLEVYNESEYVFGIHDGDGDFFYSWSELTLGPLDWLRFGLVGQRTNTYDTDLSVDRGPMLSLTFERISATIYWFNPDKSDSYAMFSLGFSF